jgi:hypothetical protein
MATPKTARPPRSDAEVDPQIAALDYVLFDAIAEFANLAASYWRSIEEAALRGERLTLEVHCRQVSAVTKEAFATVKTLCPVEVRQ